MAPHTPHAPRPGKPGGAPRVCSHPAPRRFGPRETRRRSGGGVCSCAMRFGLFFQVSESAGQSHAARFDEMFELIALAESLGFDVAYLAELHFGGAFWLLASPLTVVPALPAPP